MNTPETVIKPEATTLAASGALLADISARLKQCNDRARALKGLPSIMHDGDWDKFERLKCDRLAEEISIMTEAMGVMKDMDALLSANAKPIGSETRGGSCVPASCSARVGDKYHRNGITVEIIRIGQETVTCKSSDKSGHNLFTVHFDEFIRLERKSLKWGAKFEPAHNAPDQGPNEQPKP